MQIACLYKIYEEEERKKEEKEYKGNNFLFLKHTQNTSVERNKDGRSQHPPAPESQI
jgi:hypothetical protein